MNDSRESHSAISSQNQIGLHEALVQCVQAAETALHQAQGIDRQLYQEPRFSKRISSALRTVGGILDDAEILRRCGGLLAGRS